MGILRFSFGLLHGSLREAFIDLGLAKSQKDQACDSCDARLARWEIGCAVILLTSLLGWIAFTFSHPSPADVGLAYNAGLEAMRTGHPEAVQWISTPFLAFLMAVLSQAASLSTVVTGLNTINIAAIGAAFTTVWKRLRAHVSPRWWWFSLFLSLSFAPLSSSVWWKQFNVLSVAGAFFAFYQLRLKPRRIWLPVIIASLSLAIKPICILLPLALVLRKETRRAGLHIALLTTALIGLGQTFLATRSGQLSDLIPTSFLQVLSYRISPANNWVCHPENFSPQSLLCRLIGNRYWGTQQVVIGLTVFTLMAFGAESVRSRPSYDWSIFAFVCLLSPMVSPIAWSHYQITLLPMLLLLAYEFRNGARWPLWLGLLLSYASSQLVWQPFGTLPGILLELLTDRQESRPLTFTVMSVAMFAQYLLLTVALIWFGKIPSARLPEQTTDGMSLSMRAQDKI